MTASPPLSPVLSETVSLPDEDSISELAGLSDVSGFSSDDDEAGEARRATAQGGSPRARTTSEEHDFEEITQSMIASAVAHDGPPLHLDSDSDSAHSPALYPVRDADQAGGDARDTVFTTPTASTYRSNRSVEAAESLNTTPVGTSLITSRDLVFPNPHSDGTSPFGLASSIHSDASLEVGGDDTLMDMEDASIIDSTGESVPKKHKGRKAGRSTRRLRQRASRPILSESLFVDKKIGVSTSQLTDDYSGHSGIETPPPDASVNPPALFLKLGPHFSIPRRHVDAAVPAHNERKTVRSAKDSSRASTLRHGQRWPTILTFGVVGIVVAWAGVTYNSSNAVLSDVLARQHDLMSRHSAQGDALPAPPALPTSPSDLTAFVETLPVATPIAAPEPIRAAQDVVSALGDSSILRGSTASSGIAEGPARDLSTLSSVSSALSLPMRRLSRLPDHFKPGCATGGSLAWRHTGKQLGKGKGKGKASSEDGVVGRVMSLDLRNIRVGLISLPSAINLTCATLHSSPSGPLLPRNSRKRRWAGTQHQRKKARRLVRYLQETATAYQDTIKPKRRVAELALPGVSSAATPDDATPLLLEWSWESVFTSGTDACPDEEPASPDSSTPDQTFEQDGTSRADQDDLLLLPLSLNQSVFTILPSVELYALFIWLRDSFDIYVSYLTSHLTLDASVQQSARQAVVGVDRWSSTMTAHAQHLHRRARRAMHARAERVLAASERWEAKWIGAQGRAQKHYSNLHKRSITNARKLVNHISRKISRHRQSYRAAFKH